MYTVTKVETKPGRKENFTIFFWRGSDKYLEIETYEQEEIAKRHCDLLNDAENKVADFLTKDLQTIECEIITTEDLEYLRKRTQELLRKGFNFPGPVFTSTRISLPDDHNYREPVTIFNLLMIKYRDYYNI